MIRMVRVKSLLLAGALTVGTTAYGQQEKPRVYINGTGNVNVQTDASAAGGRSLMAGASQSTASAHNQAMELAKDFSKQCPGAIVTLNAADADYAVRLNHEASHALIFKNNQVMVTNRRGDLLASGITRAVSHSTIDYCAAILSDWKTNGRIELTAPAATALAVASQPQVSATPVTAPPTPAPAIDPTMHVVDPQPESLGDAARRLKAQKQHPSPPPQN